MAFFGKPKNKWGWVRIISCALLSVVVVWMMLAAVIREIDQVPSNSTGIAVILLLSLFTAAWLEEHDLRVETEQSNYQEAERAAAAQRKEIIKHFDEAILSLLPEIKHGAAEIPAQVRVKIDETIRAALLKLDGKGKGEMLHFLFERDLLCGENSLVEWDGADFSGATLHNARLNRVCMEGVDLRKARLDGAHLAKSRLSRANLRKAYLRHADLREAVLVACNLSGAHLEHANLEGADLSDASLEGAFLINANLSHCVLGSLAAGTEQPEAAGVKERLDRLDQAILVETILPDGRKMTNENGKAYLQKKEMAFLIDRL